MAHDPAHPARAGPSRRRPVGHRHRDGVRVVQPVELHRRVHRGRRPDPGALSGRSRITAGFRYPASVSRWAAIAVAPTMVVIRYREAGERMAEESTTVVIVGAGVA